MNRTDIDNTEQTNEPESASFWEKKGQQLSKRSPDICADAKPELDDDPEAAGLVVFDTGEKRFKRSVRIIISIVAALVVCFAVLCQVYSEEQALVFSEAMSDNITAYHAGGAGYCDWLEIENLSDKDVSLEGYALTDNLSKPDRFVFADQTIAANSWLLISCADTAEGELTANFGLSKDGETVYLLDKERNIVTSLEIPALAANTSWARRDSGKYGYCTEPTPGEANTTEIFDQISEAGAEDYSAIKISELVRGGAEPYIELCNTSEKDIDISGLYLSDNKSNTDKWKLSGKVAAGSMLSYELSGAGMKISSGAAGVYLFDAVGTPIDELSWAAGTPEELSVLPGGLCTPDKTPGEANSQRTYAQAQIGKMDSAAAVRINEVLPDNKHSIADENGEHRSWIELYNSGPATVELSDYCLSDDESDAAKWVFPEGESIAPGEYKVVFLGGDGKTEPAFKLSDNENSVYLLCLTDMTIDTAPSGDEGEDVSVGRSAAGEAEYYRYPTPGAKNSRGFALGEKLFDPAGLYISEVCAVSGTKEAADDWIELYNGSSADIEMSRVWLSDDLSDPQKWEMPGGSIGGGEYAAFDASECSGMAISVTGERLYLWVDGELADVFDTGSVRSGVTSGRAAGSEGRLFFAKATRGSVNAEGSSGFVSEPAFSSDRLYCSAAFELELTCDTQGAQIYYTTNGSTPTESSALYSGPISITGDTVVTAAAFANGMIRSDIIAKTYLFREAHTMPVVCITGESGELGTVFSGSSRGYKPGYTARFEYFEADGTLGVTFDGGICAKGRASLDNAQKSVVVKLRGRYGQSSVTYPFFDEGEKTLSSFVLRAAGQDYNGARMRDSYFNLVAANLEIDAVRTTPVIVYVNGKYWGIYDFNEEINADYIESYYGITDENLDMINQNKGVIHGDASDYLSVREIGRNKNTNDTEVWQTFSGLVDVEACTDYLIMRTYFGDGDVVNQRFWRARDYSQKWQPVLFDMDFCLRGNSEDRNVIEKYFSANGTLPLGAAEGTVSRIQMDIFYGLFKNDDWKTQFAERVVELSLTEFSNERLLEIFDKHVAELEPEMAEHISRWGAPSSVSRWKDNVAGLREAVAERREIFYEQMQSKFGISDSELQEMIDKHSGSSAQGA